MKERVVVDERQRALLVGANIGHASNFRESMEELRELALACEFEVVGQVEQNLKVSNRTYYIGSGKVQEVKVLLDENEADVVIFDNELSPSQLRNLEKALERKVMDRTALILEIFARRAKTREAKLQVEVAYLQYMLPRLVGRYEALSQQTGGVGTTTRGVGEKKLELDRRKIEERISELNKELELLSKERQIQRKKRKKSDLPLVALVGYTNSGKSTLMNALVELCGKPDTKKVLEKDMLFATLDTSVRRIDIPDNKAFLLSDTVGFIDKLPHNLVKAFRSTLEEVREADLLLHVVDVSNPNYEQQIEVTNKTLAQIATDNIPAIYVYNKADLTGIDIPLVVKGEDIYMSAKEGIGLEELVQLISKKIFSRYVKCQMLIPYDQGKVVAYFNENADILSMSYKNEGIVLTMECRESDYMRYQRFVCGALEETQVDSSPVW
jgi:GTP-binding protein HflX